MKLRPVLFLIFALSTSLLAAADAPYQLKPVKEAPEGLSDAVAAALNPEGVSLHGPDGPVAAYWVVKEAPAKPNFSPTLNVKYPFTPGQLLGAMQVSAKSGITDFRGQEIPAGSYTLRYGKQPEDGNHIGTSELYDFLLAIPAKVDTKAEPVADFELAQQSAKSAGSTHPAIYSMTPADAAAKAPALEHDKNHDFWIIQLDVNTVADGKKKALPIRFVAIGRSPE